MKNEEKAKALNLKKGIIQHTALDVGVEGVLAGSLMDPSDDERRGVSAPTAATAYILWYTQVLIGE